MANAEVARRMAQKIQLREKASNVFLTEFVSCILYCVIIMTHMWFWNRGDWAIVVQYLTRWIPIVSLATAVVMFVLPFIPRVKIERKPSYNAFVYFFAYLGLLYCLYNLHIALGSTLGNVSWLSVFRFGNERFGAMPCAFGWVGLGLVACFIKYQIKYRRIGKMFNGNNKEKAKRAKRPL